MTIRAISIERSAISKKIYKYQGIKLSSDCPAVARLKAQYWNL
jgi:hypothetical protein